MLKVTVELMRADIESKEGKKNSRAIVDVRSHNDDICDVREPMYALL